MAQVAPNLQILQTACKTAPHLVLCKWVGLYRGACPTELTPLFEAPITGFLSLLCALFALFGVFVVLKQNRTDVGWLEHSLLGILLALAHVALFLWTSVLFSPSFDQTLWVYAGLHSSYCLHLFYIAFVDTHVIPHKNPIGLAVLYLICVGTFVVYSFNLLDGDLNFFLFFGFLALGTLSYLFSALYNSQRYQMKMGYVYMAGAAFCGGASVALSFLPWNDLICMQFGDVLGSNFLVILLVLMSTSFTSKYFFLLKENDEVPVGQAGVLDFSNRSHFERPGHDPFGRR
jgi:hypothetical protein